MFAMNVTRVLSVVHSCTVRNVIEHFVGSAEPLIRWTHRVYITPTGKQSRERFLKCRNRCVYKWEKMNCVLFLFSRMMASERRV